MKYPAVALLALLVSGCGFQLQGQQPLPPALQTVYLETADRHSDFTLALRAALRSSGAQLLEQADAAGAVVRVVQDEVSETVLSVDARNIPTDFELQYDIAIAVRSAGKELMAEEPFTLSRIYSFNERKLLANEREKDILRGALARDLASVVIRRLSSL
jgi:LPS-assembly lipoprotein